MFAWTRPSMQHTGGHGFAGPVPAQRRRDDRGSTGAIVRRVRQRRSAAPARVSCTRAAWRRGFVEPRTTITTSPCCCVAHDGEWTRRRVPSEEWATTSPTATACVVRRRAGGHPDRMRAYNRAQKERLKQQLRPRPRQRPGASSSTGSSDSAAPSPADAVGVRTPTRVAMPYPVHPTVRGPRSTGVHAGPAMSRCAQGRSTMNSSRNAAAKTDPPAPPVVLRARRRPCSRCGPPRGSRRGSAGARASSPLV